MSLFDSTHPYNMQYIPSSIARKKDVSHESYLDKLRKDVIAAKSLFSNRKVTAKFNELQHGEFVARISLTIGVAAGLSQEELLHLHVGSIIHDIGKYDLPESILYKDGLLTCEEYELVKQHVISGSIKTSSIFDPNAIQIVVYHHEHYNGSGYMRGLKGEGIPYLARIVTVADVYSAMVEKRYYRQETILETDAASFVSDQSGAIFDPYIVKLFTSLFDAGGAKQWMKV